MRPGACKISQSSHATAYIAELLASAHKADDVVWRDCKHQDIQFGFAQSQHSDSYYLRNIDRMHKNEFGQHIPLLREQWVELTWFEPKWLEPKQLEPK